LNPYLLADTLSLRETDYLVSERSIQLSYDTLTISSDSVGCDKP
jgi:hypothetical protein